LDLLCSLERQIDFGAWSLLRLLDEYSDYDDSLTYGRHIKRPRDAIAPKQAHLPEFSFQMLHMGFA